MGTIVTLSFVHPSSARSPRLTGAPADILLFTGVHYRRGLDQIDLAERPTDPDGRNDRPGRPRRRRL